MKVGSQSDNFSTLGATKKSILRLKKNIEMAAIYKVVEVEGKGLGCVASKGQKISGGNCDVFDSPKKPDFFY